jgi:hypothetical protein
MQGRPLRLVPRSQPLHRIDGHLRRRRDVGQQPAIRAAARAIISSNALATFAWKSDSIW